LRLRSTLRFGSALDEAYVPSGLLLLAQVVL